MKALWLRELRAARLWAVLWATVYLAAWLQEVLSDLPASVTQATHHGFTTEGASGLGVVEFLVAFAMGQRVVLRELDDGSIRGLDVLPVPRRAVFAAKLLACAAVLLGAQGVAAATALAFTAATRGALDPGWWWGLTVRECGLSLAATGLGTAVGIGLAGTGTNAWMALALAATGLLVVGQFAPWARGWNPLRLHVMAWMSGGWVMPVGALGRQGGVALAGLVYGALWYRRADRRDGTDGMVKGTSLAVRVLAVTGMGLVLGLTALATLGGAAMGQRMPTRRYVFVVRPRHLARAMDTIRRADGYYGRVARRAGIDAPLPLSVDATQAIDHLGRSGDASGLTIRLAPAVLDDTAQAQRTLLHETTHVMGRLLSDGHTDDHGGAVRVFDEGLATVWARDLADPGCADNGVVAGVVLALLHGQRSLRTADVTDFQDLSTRHDPDLAYPLGEAFVRAMEDVHGPDAPVRVLRALRNDSGLAGLKGEAFWRALMAQAGMSFDRVTDALFVRLDATVAAYPGLSAVPALEPDVTVHEGRMQVGLTADGPSDARVRVEVSGGRVGLQRVCRFRDPTDERREQYVTTVAPCALSLRRFAGPTLAVQVGWLVSLMDANGQPVEDGAQVAWRPWVEVRIDGA